VYAIPADAPDRFAEHSTEIQTGAFGASDLLERAYGRAIRFDMGTDCGPSYLDITTVRLPERTTAIAALAEEPGGTVTAVRSGLERAGLLKTWRESPSDNFVVWLDGPAPAGSCGEAEFYDDRDRTVSNVNEMGGLVAVIYRSRGGDRFCDSRVVRHEIGHTLGAVPSSAPHSSGDGHCDDSYEDTMCLASAPPVAGYSGEFFDYGNDDYWDPPGGSPLPWWTVNLSSFICPAADCNRSPGAASASASTAESASSTTAAGKRERRATKPGLNVRAVRRGMRWTLDIKARGIGRATLTVRCAPRRAYRRLVTLPIHTSVRASCRARPKVDLTSS
jgi:hypothetical protein